MTGQNRKQVNAILRKNAERIERANKRAVACPNCKFRVEKDWNYCANCGAGIWATPSTTDRPFGCPPDEEGA